MDSTKDSRDAREEIAAGLISPAASPKPHTPLKSLRPQQPRVEAEILNTGSDSKDESAVESAAALFPTPPQSPRLAPNLPPAEETPKEETPTLKDEASTARTPELSFADLKIRLGLDTGKCGGFAYSQNRPCRRPASGGEEQIDHQIQSMINLRRSSPELQVELIKLVMLVHCRDHKRDNYRGRPKESRVEDWTLVFPADEDEDPLLVPIEVQIEKALGEIPIECIWKAQDSKCMVAIGGQRVQNCTKTLRKIIEPEIYLDDSNLEYLLKVLEINMYCKTHNRNKTFSEVASWKSQIIQIREQANSGLQPGREIQTNKEDQPQQLVTQESKAIAIKNLDSPGIEAEPLSNLEASWLLSLKAGIDPATFWPEAFDTSPFEKVRPYEDDYADKSEFNRIQRTIREGLDWKDRLDGYIYLYQVEGNEGFVKLGYTSRTINTRHQEWTDSCNREIKSLYPLSSHSVVKLPNARRIEALCHAELHNRRVRTYCNGCLKDHIEWFEVSPEYAVSIINKWSKWMMTGPYYARPLRGVTKCYLQAEEQRRTNNMDEFMKEISEAAVRPTKES